MTVKIKVKIKNQSINQSISQPHLEEVQAFFNIFNFMLIILDHLLHLLPVRVGVNSVGDVCRRWRHSAGGRDPDAHRRHDEGRPEGEGRQNQAGDGGDAAGDAGHPSANARGHRLPVEAVGGVR